MLGGAFFHTKCACHILNLIVKDGLQVDEVDSLLEKYYKALKFVDSSTKKKQNFAELCSRMGILSVKIPWDIETRWNSTYLLLKKTLHLKPAIDQALSRCPTGQLYRLNPSDWMSLEALVPFLDCFYTATVRLSATYTPTASALLEDLVAISDWYEQQIKNLPEDSARSAQQQGRRGEGSSGVSQPSNLSRRGRGSVSRLLNILNKCSDTPIQQQSNTEIQIYISSDYATVKVDDENFDILRFWNQVKGVLPILSSMARDIFAVPVSTVASESCFSGANRVLTDKRTRLGLETFEALVLLKDWYDTETRLQDKSWMHMVPELGEIRGTNISSSSQHQNEGSQDVIQIYGFNPYQCNYEDYGYHLGDYESWNY
ncbi:Zinc finger BED domain-containing protein RICESLEEPER 4 [Rhynchospora pubera]|uniref:Zinc finger BED domain-containing protein RICESLEEPER 4 n=1 Tax=Rhynchospora pubera TaxID=906938 RepID=A0AAV8G6Q5_9POAL|nr:Zinc finger BED domain-containing protein RICESLEEPER 4 [Rhynchospora pubera]